MVCSACWSHAWDLSNLGNCYAQVNRYPGNLHKKYNTEAKALRAYYSHLAYLTNHGQPCKPCSSHLVMCMVCSPMNANYGHPPALEIEQKPPVGDVKIRRIAPWSWKDVMLFIYGYGHYFSYLEVDVGLVSQNSRWTLLYVANQTMNLFQANSIWTYYQTLH